MSWVDALFERLNAGTSWGYRSDQSGWSEPTAFVALAALAHKQTDIRDRALSWLCNQQAEDGHVSVHTSVATPGWPTALAVLAWSWFAKEQAAQAKTPGPVAVRQLPGQLAASTVATRAMLGSADFHELTVNTHDQTGQLPEPARAFAPSVDTLAKRCAASSQLGLAWLLKTEGLALQPSPHISHDTSLIGWPWVVGTHSWNEPTALAVLALKAMGQTAHPRYAEAIRLLNDRMLPTGGCNYGNKVVLGQELRPHLQPTGLVLLALDGAETNKGTQAKACRFLLKELQPETSVPSLCYGLMALRAHGQPHPHAADWLAAKAEQLQQAESSPLHMALALLAAAAIPWHLPGPARN